MRKTNAERAAAGKSGVSRPGSVQGGVVMVRPGWGRDNRMSKPFAGWADPAGGLSSGMKKAPQGCGAFGVARCTRAIGHTGRGSLDYQILIGSLRTISEPGLHWNALAKASMFEGAAKARIFGGACGSVLRRISAVF